MKLFAQVEKKSLDRRFFVITQWAYAIGVTGHLGALILFSIIGLDAMVKFNLYFSIPVFTIALILNTLGRLNLAFSIAFLELLAHQVISTYFLGWDFGAHIWLIYLSGLLFFFPTWNRKIQYGLLVLILLVYVYMYFNFQSGVFPAPEGFRKFGELVSAITAITIISLLISYYSRTSKQAENRLKEEEARSSMMLKRVEALFGQQVSEEIANELISSNEDFTGKQYDVSIMFLDIRDFTGFADSHSPNEVAAFQNAIFGELIEIVRVNKGVVLQILGDGIMAIFGAPKVVDNHPQLAVNAGNEMLKTIRELSEKDIIPRINVGIGINTGKVIAGNVGNESRKFYTITGKDVIIASRLEQLNKQYMSQFLISNFTYDRLEKKPESQFLGEVGLRGIEKSIGVYLLA